MGIFFWSMMKKCREELLKRREPSQDNAPPFLLNKRTPPRKYDLALYISAFTTTTSKKY